MAPWRGILCRLPWVAHKSCTSPARRPRASGQLPRKHEEGSRARVRQICTRPLDEVRQRRLGPVRVARRRRPRLIARLVERWVRPAGGERAGPGRAVTAPERRAMLARVPRATPRATCIAQGTHEGVPWSCERPAASGGLCEGHRKARQRGRPMLPLREHFHGPAVLLTIRITEQDRAQLGADASARASAIVRSALAERRRKRSPRATPQLRLGFEPRRRRP